MNWYSFVLSNLKAMRRTISKTFRKTNSFRNLETEVFIEISFNRDFELNFEYYIPKNWMVFVQNLIKFSLLSFNYYRIIEKFFSHCKRLDNSSSSSFYRFNKNTMLLKFDEKILLERFRYNKQQCIFTDFLWWSWYFLYIRASFTVMNFSYECIRICPI